MTFFSGNPFATAVGQKIETATSDTLASEDWSLNLEICDLINGTEDGPKDAIKAIRKRLSATPKNYTVILYTLTVLETCVKNCGKRFHLLACAKDFVQEMVKLIGPKNEPPSVVQEKVLSLIQSWSEAFKHQPDLSGVSQVYTELKHKGVKFPFTNLETTAPIITPQRTVAPEEPSPSHRAAPPTGASPRRQMQSSQGLPARPPNQVPSGPVSLTPDQKAKLMSELDVVESNAKVLAEMLNELTPGKEHPEDQQLLQDLHMTCQQMQQRVVELVGRINDDILTIELLRINDNLNNLFIRYDCYMSKLKSSNPDKSPTHTNASATSKLDSPSGRPTPKQSKEPEVSLIDLDDAPSSQMNDLSLEPKPTNHMTKVEDVDFDSFAQSRTGVNDTPKASSKPDVVAASLGAQASAQLPKTQQKDTDFDEMERWLNENPGMREAGINSSTGKKDETITSSEFDKFLAERAAAADNLPTIPAAVGSTSPSQQRTMSRTDDKEKKMFAL